jgi:ferredoxin
MALHISVDWTRCNGIGICESIAPDHFEVGDDGALIARRVDVSDAERDSLEEAVRACPTMALSLSEERTRTGTNEKGSVSTVDH